VKGVTSVDDRQKVLNTAVTTIQVHMKILLRFIIQYIIKKTTMTFFCATQNLLLNTTKENPTISIQSVDSIAFGWTPLLSSFMNSLTLFG
jgi:hypothetical protein